MPPDSHHSRESQATEIEVEVVEIDGVPADTMAPAGRRDLREPAVEHGGSTQEAGRQPWHPWQGRVRTLDSRWWPLWLLLGIIALVLLLTVGVVLAVVFLIVRACQWVVRAILR